MQLQCIRREATTLTKKEHRFTFLAKMSQDVRLLFSVNCDNMLATEHMSNLISRK